MLRPDPGNDSGREEGGQGASASPRSSPSRRTPIVRNWTGGPLVPSVTAPLDNDVRGSERVGSPDSALPNSNNNGPTTVKHTARRRSRPSVSEAYYGTVEVSRHPPVRPAAENEAEIKPQSQMRQSRRIPPWIWWILAKSLGIKVHRNDKPLFGTLMHVLTLLFSFMFAITNTWYKVYDIKSEYTKETVLAGMVSVVIGLYWSSLGVYANLLAGRLFSNPRFKDSVRLHSKTIFKISAAGLMIFLSFTVITMNVVGARHLFADSSCERISLNVLICKFMYISRVCYSMLSLVWNAMVGVVMLSVCRTHTIGIRRFIKELEEDGRRYEMHQRRSGRDHSELFDPSDDLDDSILWQELEDDDEENIIRDSEDEGQQELVSPVVDEDVIFRGPQPYMRSEAPPLDTPTRRNIGQGQNRNPGQTQGQTAPEVKTPIPISRQTQHAKDDFETVELAVGGATQKAGGDDMKDMPPKIIIQDEDSREQVNGMIVIENRRLEGHQAVDIPSIASRSSRSNAGSPNFSTRADYCNSPRHGMSEGSESSLSQASQPAIMSNDEILLSYWKISCRLRNTSLALQRWLMAVIMLVILWSTTYIIYWVRHEATLLGIGEFVIPILLLPIICSAYGEVNYEGRRMLKCICPTTKRSGMLFYLTNNPLEMNVFGSPINYSTIGTVLTALGLAFASRLILDEMKM